VQSFAHAWSSGAVGALSNYVLGIRPVSPGFSTWIVAPQLGDLTWAQGQVPTPHGPVASRWALGAGDRSFTLTVAAPGGTLGTVAVPELGSSRTIAEDGRVVWRAGQAVGAGIAASEQDGAAQFSDVSGVHTFAWGPEPVATPIAECARRRHFAIHVTLRVGERVRTARLLIAGRRAGRVRVHGRRLVAVVDLHGRPRGVARVRLVVHLQGGLTRVFHRTYHPCTARRR
jgi:hypothetical protein